MWYNTMWYNTMWYNTMWYNTMWYNTMWYNTKHTKEKEMTMSRKHMSLRMNEDMIEYADYLAKELGISKSSVPEFTMRIVDTYFSVKELKMELLANAPEDGRKRKG